MGRQTLIVVGALLVVSGLSLAQTATKSAATEQVKDKGENAADRIGRTLENAGDAVKSSLGLAKTGCLKEGDEADPFVLVGDDADDRITVVGSADLPKHVNHRVRVFGNEEADGRVFHVTKIEHISTSCDTPAEKTDTAAKYGEKAVPQDATSPRAESRGVTADDQGFNTSDSKITQSIRKAVTADDSMSVYAKNVKIITRDGMVTLRGPVRTAQEKQNIEAMAAAVVGAANVKNELMVDAGSGR